MIRFMALVIQFKRSSDQNYVVQAQFFAYIDI